MADHGSDAPVRTVTYQGVPGAFSYEACGQAEPDLYAVPCTSFEEVLKSVREGRAERAVIPIETSTFGRAADIQDDEHNTTRFLVMAREPIELECRTKRMITSFVFIVRNVPAALYKALGGFATAGVNVVKIESYMVEGSFSTVQFYVEVEGRPEEERVQIAIDELRFYCSHTQILGVYPAHPYRSLRC